MTLAGVLAAQSEPTADDDEVFSDCLEAVEQRPRTYETSVCFFLNARAQGLWTEAAGYLMALRRQDPDDHWATLALAYVEQSRNGEDVIRLYRQAADGFQERQNAKGEVIARVNLSAYALTTGRITTAKEALNRAESVAQRSQDAELILRTELSRFEFDRQTGKGLERAYRALSASKKLTEAPSQVQGGGLLALANGARALGKPFEAVRHLRRLIELQEESKALPLQLALARYNLAAALSEGHTGYPTPEGRAEVVAAYRQALEASITPKLVALEALARRGTAYLLAEDEKRATEAARHLERCLAAARHIGAPHIQSQCIGTMGRLRAADDPRAAKALLRKAIVMAARSAYPSVHVFALRDQNIVLEELGDWRDALDSGLRAIRLVENLRDAQEGELGQMGILARWADDYYRLSGQLLKRHTEEQPTVELAFAITERLRARILSERLEKLGISSAGLFLAPEAKLPLKMPLDSRTSTVAFPGRERLSDVQEALRDNEAFVSFQLGLEKDLFQDFGGGAWAVVIQPNDIGVLPVPDRVAASQVVPSWVGLFPSRGDQEAAPATSAHRRFFADIAKTLDPRVEHLIVVPDGPLHELPFSALRSEAEAAPLGARFEISSVPSAGIWLGWKRASVDAPEQVWVLADSGAGGALPFARSEAQLILDAIGRSRVRLFTGAEASRTTLETEAIDDVGILHFATHAVLNVDRPDESAILLASGRDDGQLKPDQIAALDLKGRVVVLAGCRTATGKVARGEGVLSLARAFFEAGAQVVIGSRWPIRDDEAEAFFASFYRQLADGASIGKAVQMSRKALWQSGYPAEAWAGFVVLGDGSLIPYPGGLEPVGWTPRGATLLALIVLALVVGMGVALALNRRRRIGRP